MNGIADNSVVSLIKVQIPHEACIAEVIYQQSVNFMMSHAKNGEIMLVMQQHCCIVKVFCSNERIYFYKKYKLNLYLAAILLALMFQTHKCLYIYLLVLIESIQVVQCAGPVIDIDSVFTPTSCFSYIFLLVLILKLELLYNGFFWHLM